MRDINSHPPTLLQERLPVCQSSRRVIQQHKRAGASNPVKPPSLVSQAGCREDLVESGHVALEQQASLLPEIVRVSGLLLPALVEHTLADVYTDHAAVRTDLLGRREDVEARAAAEIEDLVSWSKGEVRREPDGVGGVP
jgi:hypothetical protein